MVRPGYKRTEVGDIPEDWDVCTIGSLCSISSGTTPARHLSERYFRNGTTRWVKTLDLNNGRIRSTDECVTEAALAETSLRVYQTGTVLVAMYGGFEQIGRTGLLEVPACVNQALSAVQSERSRLAPAYLLHFLNHNVRYWRSVASSSRRDPNISSRDVAAFPIAHPPLPEQVRISETLDGLQALIESLEHLLAKKRAIKQGAMQSLLTGAKRLPGFSTPWKRQQLGNLALLSKAIVNPAAQPTATFTHFSLPAFDASASPIVEPGSAIASHKFVVPGNAVLLSKLNPRIPRVWMPKSIPANSVCSTEFLVLVPREGTARDFLKVACSSPTVGEQMELHAIGTTGSHQRIHPDQAMRIEFDCPTNTGEQAAIAEVLADLDADLDATTAKLDKARALKQGMMQELLTGRIRLV